MFNPRATRVRIERFYIHTHVHINVDIRDTNGDKVRRSITYTHTAALESTANTSLISASSAISTVISRRCNN